MTENKEKVEIKPGAGLGSGNAIRGSTTIFRALNFELFVKPNKYVMVAGSVAISICAGYIIYMNLKARNDPKNIYVAIAEDGTQFIQPKKSRWD